MGSHRFNEKMKKKLIISSYDDMSNPYYAGGGALAVHQTAKGLLNDFDVTVITGNYPGAENHKRDGVIYKRIGPQRGGPKLGQLFYQFLLPVELRRQRFDLWIESFTPPFSTAMLPLFTRKPVVGLVHMLSGEDMRRKYLLPFHLIEALGLKTYHHFIAPSDVIKQQIAHHNRKATITTISSGYEPLSLSQTQKKHLLFIGRIEMDQKGIDLLLKAYKEVATTISYPLVIAGGGEAKQIAMLQQMIADYHLEEKVQLVGRVSGEKKAKLFSQAKAVIVPSRFETFSITSLEALGSGVPLITFAIPGLSWIPKDAHLTVPAFSVSELAKAMQIIVNDREVAQKLSRAGKRYAKDYEWDAVTQKYATLLKGMVRS